MSARGDTKPWVELFDFMTTDDITRERTQSNFADGRTYCRICDAYIASGTGTAHAREHKREMSAYLTKRAKRIQADRERRLAQARKMRGVATA